MSSRSLRVVYRSFEHVQRQHAPSDHTACAGWADATLMRRKHLTTHVACSNLAQPIPIVPSTSSCHNDVCRIKVAINTQRGTECKASTRAHRPDSESASRLLVPTSLSCHIRSWFFHSRYFAVCNASVNPSAVCV